VKKLIVIEKKKECYYGEKIMPNLFSIYHGEKYMLKDNG
jgi:hypothetical protein